MATPSQIAQVVRAQPFVPFVVHLVDGRTFTVKQPEAVAVAGTRELLFVGDDEGIHQLDMRLVAEIEKSAAAPQS
jgi:hypothetical protein